MELMDKYRFQNTFTRIPFVMRFSKLFYVVFLLTGMQCRSPYNIDIGDQNVLYQVSAYVVPSKPILFYVSKVGQPVGEADYQLKDTAKIYFTNGSNEYLIEPKYFPNQLNPVYQLSNWNATSDESEIKVIFNSGQQLSSKVSIPKDSISCSIDYTETSFIDNAVQSVKLQMHWPDQTQTFHYYHLIIKKVDWNYDGQGGYKSEGLSNVEITPSDSRNLKGVTLLSHEPGLLLTDALLMENNMNLDLLVKTLGPISRNKERFKELQIELRTVSEEYYKFHKSVALQLSSSQSGFPVLEPIRTYTNIIGGQGIFASYRSTFSTKLIQ